jgi:hypothetical protein
MTIILPGLKVKTLRLTERRRMEVEEVDPFATGADVDAAAPG